MQYPPPFFSIVIVTYNCVDLLSDTIRTLLEQDFSDYEVLLIDGCSTDGTLELAQKLLLNTQSKIVSEKDDGIYDAMNKGISFASGKYLYFLNAGDCLLSTVILTSIATVATHNDLPNFIYGNVELVDNKANHRYIKLAPKTIQIQNFISQTPICHQASFYKKDILVQHGCYDLKYNILADYKSILTIFLSDNKLFYININIAEYELDGFSAQQVVQCEKQRFNILSEFELAPNYFFHKISLLFLYVKSTLWLLMDKANLVGTYRKLKNIIRS